MSNPTRLTSGSAWAFLGRMGALTFAFASSVILARVLAPDDFGAYFLVLTIARVAMLLGQVGMNQVVVRFIAGSMASGQPGRARDTVLKSFIIASLGSCLVGGVYFLSSRLVAVSVFDTPIMMTVSGVVVLWIIAGSLRLMAAECFRGFNDLKMASLFEVFIFEFLFAFLIFAAWHWHGGIVFYNVVLLAVIAALISAFFAVFVLRRKTVPLPAEDLVTYNELLRTGWPLLVSNMVVVVMVQAGLWIVGAIASPSDVARYASAFRLVLLMQLPLLIFNSVVPQLIAGLHAQSRKMEIEKTLRMIATAEFIPTIIIYGIFLLFGKSLLVLCFGSFYAGGFLILILLGAGILVNAWAGFCGPALMMTGNQQSLMVISLFCGALALLLAFPLGKRFGAEGVAASMAFANGVQHVWMVIAVRHRLGVWTFAGNIRGLAGRVIDYVG